MIKTSISVVRTIAMTLTLTLAGIASVSALAADSTAERSAFATDAIQGNVSYRSIYSDPAKFVGVSLHVATPSELRCLDYADFVFDLKSEKGAFIASKDTHRLHGAAQDPYGTPPVYPPVPQRMPCLHAAITYTGYLFDLNSLFGNLKPGIYHLQITLAPQDHSLPRTPLPSITFEIKR